MSTSFSTLRILATVKLFYLVFYPLNSFSTLRILATVKQLTDKGLYWQGFSTLRILATVKHRVNVEQRVWVLVLSEF